MIQKERESWLHLSERTKQLEVFPVMKFYFKNFVISIFLLHFVVLYILQILISSAQCHRLQVWNIAQFPF